MATILAEEGALLGRPTARMRPPGPRPPVTEEEGLKQLLRLRLRGFRVEIAPRKEAANV